MPAILAQVKEAMEGNSISSPAPATAPGPSPVAGPSRSAPPIVFEEPDSEEDPDVQTLAVPFRSGISDTYLPMISTEETWFADSIFR